MKSLELPEDMQYMVKGIKGLSPFAMFDFETGEGWNNMLYNLLCIIALIDKQKCVRISQVKEKFGGLRFYYDWKGNWKKKSLKNKLYLLWDILPFKVKRFISKTFNIKWPRPEHILEYQQIEDLVSWFESISYRVCEMCGEPGQERKDIGWIKTLCNKCHQKALDNRSTRFLKQQEEINTLENITVSGHLQPEDV